MKVLCIASQGIAVPAQYLDPRIPREAEREFPVTVGKMYLVYAVRFLSNQVWYYVDDESRVWYPTRMPAPLFKVVDSRMSKYWGIRVSEGKRGSDVLLAFEEWLSVAGFYDRLTDREDQEVQTYQQRKREMDEEFPEQTG